MDFNTHFDIECESPLRVWYSQLQPPGERPEAGNVLSSSFCSQEFLSVKIANLNY